MTLRTVTYDDSTHKIVPIEPTEDQIGTAAQYALTVSLTASYHWKDYMRSIWSKLIAAAPEYQEPDIRAKLAVNMIKHLGATKTQAKAIIDGVFDGEHTINESDLKYQEPTKDHQ